MLVKRRLRLGKKAKTEKEKGALDKYFSRITSENAHKALEEPSHSEDGDNAGSQPDDVMPDSRSGSLYTRSKISRFEIIESDHWSAERGGERGDGPGHPRQGGHPKCKITKI